MFVELLMLDEDKEVSLVIRKSDVIRIVKVDSLHCEVIYKPVDFEEAATILVKESLESLKLRITRWNILGSSNSVPDIRYF